MTKTPSSQYEQGFSETQAYWDHRATHFTDDSERVEQSRRTQRMRFDVFVKNHDLNGASILDVGCGVGDLLEHLRAANVQCEYTGFDISAPMIERCKQRFPDVAFQSGDFLSWEPGRRFDYVISIGIHNIRVPQGETLLREVTKKQYDLSDVAAHLSILTDRYQGFAAHIQPWRAEDALTLALSLTPYVVLRHDYLPNDFSLTLYRKPLIDTDKDYRR